MILAPTEDLALIKEIMTDSEIWEKIKEDGYDKNDFAPCIPKKVIISPAIVDSVIGLHRFTNHGDRILYHPILLKPYRKQHGREFFDKGIKWFFDKTQYSTLHAEIPITDKSTINLAKHLNFNEITTIKNGVKKNNKFIDLQVLRLEKWAA